MVCLVTVMRLEVGLKISAVMVVEFLEVAVMVPVLAWARGYNMELYACVLASVMSA